MLYNDIFPVNLCWFYLDILILVLLIYCDLLYILLGHYVESINMLPVFTRMEKESTPRFICTPITDNILNDLQMTKDNEISVKPYAHTEDSEGRSVVFSEVKGVSTDDDSERYIITGTIVLTFFDDKFNLVSQTSFPELYGEIHSMYIRHEGSLVSLSSGELVLTIALT